MKHKKITLSLVIPAYNEESYLKACLDSIAVQSVMPDEVLVIDNNSSDQTSAIAQSYSFVKLLSERRQHQSFAQHSGFNAAKSDLIGRIDADTVLPPNWVQSVKAAFEADNTMVAAKGSGDPYDVFAKGLARAIFTGYNILAGVIAGHNMLWGANCVLRRDAWDKIKNDVFLRADIWEDYDLAFCLASHGELCYLPNIEVGTSFRAVHKSALKQLQYQIRAVRTFFLRANFFRATLFAILWPTMMLMYPVVLFDQYVSKPVSRRIQKRTFSILEAFEGQY